MTQKSDEDDFLSLCASTGKGLDTEKWRTDWRASLADTPM